MHTHHNHTHTQWIYCADADSFCTWCGHHDNPHQCCLCVPPYRSSLYLLRIYCRNPNCTRDDVKRTYYTSHSARPHLDPWKLRPTHKERSPWQKECQALYIANTQTPTSNDTAISTRLAVWMGEQRRIYIYIYMQWFASARRFSHKGFGVQSRVFEWVMKATNLCLGVVFRLRCEGHKYIGFYTRTLLGWVCQQRHSVNTVFNPHPTVIWR